MTEAQLDKIEAELGLKLPAEYRAVSKEFPFRRMGNEDVYWFYDDPDRVIGVTRSPMCDGDYDMANWKPTYVIIGHGAAGDEHLIDTALADSPVYLLSHEDHSIVEEWASLAAFVEDSDRDFEIWEASEVERARQREIEARRLKILGIALVLCVLVLAIVVIFAPRSTRRSRHQAQQAASPLS